MQIINNLGTVRDFLEKDLDKYDWIKKIIKEDDLPSFLDEVYVITSDVNPSDLSRLSFTVALEKEFILNFPIPNKAQIVLGKTEDSYTFITVHIETKSDISWTFRDIEFTIRLSKKFIRPVNEAIEYSEIICSGGIVIQQNLSIETYGFDQYSLERSLLLNSGIIISAKNVELFLPSQLNDGSQDGFVGIGIESGLIELPENWEDITSKPEIENPVDEGTTDEELNEPELDEPDTGEPEEPATEEETPPLPYANIQAKNIKIGHPGGLSGELFLDTPTAGFLHTRMPFGLEVKLDKFDIKFKENKVLSSSISGLLTIPQINEDKADESEVKPAELALLATYKDTTENGETLDHALFSFSINVQEDNPLKLGEFPLRLTKLDFQFQQNKLKGFSGSGLLQLPSIKSKDKPDELAWLPFTIGLLDDFFSIKIAAVNNLTIGADTELDISNFEIRFNKEKVENFDIDIQLRVKGIKEEDSENEKSLQVKINYIHEDKTFLASASGEQKIKIGTFKGLITALNFGLDHGELSSFSFASLLAFEGLEDKEGETTKINFQIAKQAEILNFKANTEPDGLLLNFNALELNFHSFQFALIDGHLGAPSDISGLLSFPPKVENAETMTFGLELLGNGYEVEVAAQNLKSVKIGGLSLEFNRFYFKHTNEKTEFDIRGLLRSKSFKDTAGKFIDNLAFQIQILDDGFELVVVAPENQSLELLHIKKVLEVNFKKTTLGKTGSKWYFNFIGDFINHSEVPFVQKVIPQKFIFNELAFDSTSFIPSIGLDIEWADGQKNAIDDIKDGLLELLVPINLSIGGIFKAEHLQINTVKPKAGQFGIEIIVLAPSVKLGPVTGSIDAIGFQLNTDESGEGNLGFVDFKPQFSAPKGMGLEVKAPLISGGGYLKIDKEAGTFEGVLALSLKTIDITAIGLIATKFPNGKRGFSILISISSIFRPGIQLSFGFTLNGVGGLIGINRTMSVDKLRRQIRAGRMDNVMFPRDVVKNTPAIISNLRSIFPVQKKHHVVAPFLKIGWGTPTIIEVDLGVFIEVPFKGRIILLGSVGLVLPVPKAPLVRIRIDVLGDFNFASRYIRIEGVLRDSKIVGIPLNGGFAFVLGWGRKPQFLFSIGGYHPRYKKPALFPEIGRLSAVIKKGKKLVLTCAYYQAITSNSYQIGASANLKARFAGAKIEGYLSFDALLSFNPFQFELDIHLGVSIKVRGKKLAGVELYFILRGPKPWVVQGYAKIRIVFFKLKIKLRLKWGGKQKAQKLTIQPQVLLDRLSGALSNKRNWKVILPKYLQTAEIFRELKEGEQDFFIHPSGYLEVRQNVLPLNRRINLNGKTYISGSPIYKINSIKSDTQELLDNHRSSKLKEYFSLGQFKELTKAQQLSLPDFQLMQAGVRLNKLVGFKLSEDFESSLLVYEIEILREEKSQLKTATRRVGSRSAIKSKHREKPISTAWSTQRKSLERSRRIQNEKNKGENRFGLYNDLPVLEKLP